MFNNQAQDANNRLAQRANRNASSFNIISFDPNANNQGNIDKQLKKDKQNAYRDQLDQMRGFKQDQRSQNAYGGDNAYNRSAMVTEQSRQKKSWDADRDNYEAAQYDREPVGYNPDQQYNDYGINQHANDIQKNYNLGNNQSGVYGGGHQQQQQQQQPPRSRPVTDQSGASTFDQQDALRNQLLDRIRSGYSNQNFNVYNAYQRAHDEKESNRQNFEHNVIDKAARERVQKEQDAAMRDWDKKKRLQMEMSEANRRAIDAKTSQKRRDKETDLVTEQQRNQDSLAQHEKNEYLQREKMRRMRDDTNQTLQSQMQESAVHKSQHGKEISPSKYKVGWDSIDRLSNQPLKSSSQLMNQDPYGNRGGQAQYEDLSHGMGNLDMGGQKGGYQEDPYGDQYGGQGYGQPPSNRNVNQGLQNSQVNDYSKIKDKNRHGSGFNIITGEYR